MSNYNNFFYLLSQHTHLETENLLLRPIRMEDAADLYEYSANPDNTRYIYESFASIEDAYSYIATYFLNQPLGKYGIELKQSGKLIGTIALQDIEPELKRAELSYILNKAYWYQGYTSEACHELVRLAFEALDMNYIQAKFDQENVGSLKVMEKAGLIYKGIQSYSRFDHQVENRVITDVIYGLTKEEYEVNKRE